MEFKQFVKETNQQLQILKSSMYEIRQLLTYSFKEDIVEELEEKDKQLLEPISVARKNFVRQNRQAVKYIPRRKP